MFLRRGISNNKDPSTIYRAIEDVEKFFPEFCRESEFDAATPTAEKLSAVAAAHRIYTNTLASLPWMIRQKIGDERHEPDHYLEPILKSRANEHMTAFMANKALASQSFWYGKSFGYIDRGANGQVKGIIPLPSAGASRYIDRDSGTVWYGFSVDTDHPDYPRLRRKFTESELLIHYYESYDGTQGRGVLELARETISSDGMAQAYGKRFFKNGARVSGIVEVAGELNQTNREIIRDDFERMATGMDNAFRVAVLDLGMKYTPLGINQKDSQFLETRAFSVEEISRFTGIPAYMMQAGKQSYQSNEQQQLDFLVNTMQPHLVQKEQEWSYKLLSQREREAGMYFKLNFASILRGDNQARSAYYEKMTAIGVYNADECRALEDMSPIPGGLGRQYWKSKNYAPVQALLEGGESDGY